MGIRVEYNPDLALRNIKEYKKGKRKRVECIPARLVAGKVYEFLKKGQRLYWLEGELPLVETKGNERLSAPIASIEILEATHKTVKGEVFTSGKYKVVEVFNDDKVHFNGWQIIKD